MLFKKDMEPRCAYCKRGTLLGDDRVMCLKKGIMSAAGSCRAFRYDRSSGCRPSPPTRTSPSSGMRISSSEPVFFHQKRPEPYRFGAFSRCFQTSANTQTRKCP